MKKGLFYILLTAIVFTTLEPVSKLISNEVNPFAITFIRFFIGGVMLLPFSAAKVVKNNIRLDKSDIINMALLGILCVCVSMTLLQYAVLKADSPALIAIIFSSNSVFTMTFAALILNERFTKNKVIGLLLCVAGVLVCTDISSGSNLFSIALGVLSAVFFSLYTVLSKKFMKKVSGIIQTGFSFFMGSIVLLIVLLVSGIEVVSPINSGNILNLLYLGVAVTGIGYWSYFRAMDKTSAMAASLVFFIKPVLTPFAAFAINKIVPDWKVFLALVLVVGGSYLATGKKESNSTSTEALDAAN